jgi:hypothetical protein
VDKEPKDDDQGDQAHNNEVPRCFSGKSCSLTEEAERALQDLKHHLQSPPVLTAPLLGEDPLHYIAATTHVVSSAIVVERSEEGHAFGVQRPVYFISEILSKSKVR